MWYPTLPLTAPSDLSFNQLSSLAPGILQGLMSVVQVYVTLPVRRCDDRSCRMLNGNQLTQLTSETFEGLSNIYQLSAAPRCTVHPLTLRSDLSQNQLSSIDGVLNGLPNLNILCVGWLHRPCSCPQEPCQ